MIDFSFNRGDYTIHAKQRKIEPMWKSSPIPQFTQSELQQIQQLLCREIRHAHIFCDYELTDSKEFKHLKSKIKKLSALQTKVKHLTNL